MLLCTQPTAPAEAWPEPLRPGFDGRAGIPAEARTVKGAGISVGQNVEAQLAMAPESQPACEQQAREGKTEVLDKEAQNPATRLISLPMQ